MAGILFGTIPILMVVLAPIFLAEETFTRRRLAGGVVGLAGVILLIGPSVLANASAQTLGIAITFLGPLSHTLGAIYARRQTNLTPPTMATGQMIPSSWVARITLFWSFSNSNSGLWTPMITSPSLA